MKLIGTVAFFSTKSLFGFLVRREGTRVDKYFFHAARLISCECDPKDIKIGMFARFNPSPIPPRKAEDSPYAIDVELFINDPNGLSTLAVDNAQAESTVSASTDSKAGQ
jgi:hypothetical protein